MRCRACAGRWSCAAVAAGRCEAVAAVLTASGCCACRSVQNSLPRAELFAGLLAHQQEVVSGAKARMPEQASARLPLACARLCCKFQISRTGILKRLGIDTTANCCSMACWLASCRACHAGSWSASSCLRCCRRPATAGSRRGMPASPACRSQCAGRCCAARLRSRPAVLSPCAKQSAVPGNSGANKPYCSSNSNTRAAWPLRNSLTISSNRRAGATCCELTGPVRSAALRCWLRSQSRVWRQSAPP